MRHWQCGQTGASAWIAHSKLSKVWCLPATTTSKTFSMATCEVCENEYDKAFEVVVVDRALEAIEGVVLAGNNYLKGFVIFIFTNFTCSNTKSLSRAAAFAAVAASISPVKIVQRSRSRHVPRFHHFHQVPESRDRPRK